MQLNITSDDPYPLAELTGQSFTTVATEALRQRVHAEQKAGDKAAMFNDIRALAAEIKTEWDKAGGEPVTSNHHWLYDDETGLPV